MVIPRSPSQDPRDHPWWRHLPRAERRSIRWELRRLRFQAWWDRRASRTLVMLLIYLGFCAVPFFIGQIHLAAIAALPLILVPPIAYLSYLLIWHEFHR
jgi:hypothetical protein